MKKYVVGFWFVITILNIIPVIEHIKTDSFLILIYILALFCSSSFLIESIKEVFDE